MEVIDSVALDPSPLEKAKKNITCDRWRNFIVLIKDGKTEDLSGI